MTGATSPQATTSTPESSEAPRENRAGLGLLERFDGLAAQIADGPRRLNETADRAMGKVSSPELASLAAKYVNIDTLELMDLDRTAAFELCMDVRSLAASVLAQAEGTPRK
jgi:hypothetical protein